MRAVDGRAVDEFQAQIGNGGQELDDLAGVRVASAHRLRIALPVADDVVGQDVADSATRSGAAQKAAHMSALNFGWVWVSVMHPACGRSRAPFNYAGT